MGFTPAEVDAMSLWELAACTAGYAKAHGAEDKAPAPTAEEHVALVEKIRARRLN